MQTNPELYQGLRRLLGQTVEYRGHPLQVIDVLSDGPTLVLADQDTEIQADLHGDPRRRVQKTFSIAALDSSGEHLNPLLAESLSAGQLRLLSEISPPSGGPAPDES